MGFRSWGWGCHCVCVEYQKWVLLPICFFSIYKFVRNFPFFVLLLLLPFVFSSFPFSPSLPPFLLPSLLPFFLFFPPCIYPFIFFFSVWQLFSKFFGTPFTSVLTWVSDTFTWDRDQDREHITILLVSWGDLGLTKRMFYPSHRPSEISDVPFQNLT